MRRLATLVSIIVVTTMAGEPARSQVASLSSNEPKWGDTIIVTYDPSAEGADFSARDEVHAAAMVHKGVGAEIRPAKMTWADDRFTRSFVVQQGDAHLEFHFLTTTAWDKTANAQTIVLQPDGKPARGAKLHTMFTAKKNFDYEVMWAPMDSKTL